MAVDPSAFALPGQETGAGGKRAFADAAGNWWEYDPQKPEGQRLQPLTTPDGQQLGAQRPTAGKAPQLLKDKQGNIIGYWDPDQPDSAVYFNPDQQANRAPIPLGGGYVYNQDTGQVESLPPQPTPGQPSLHNNGHATIQLLPDGSTRVIYIDEAGIARDQAGIEIKQQELGLRGQELEDTRNRTRISAYQAQTQAGQADTQAFNSYWANVINASQQDEASQQNAFNRDYKLLYELPRTQVADENQARLNQYQAAANQGTYETGRFNAGTTAADARVRQLMETLPYRANPQFVQQYTARRAQEAARAPLTPYSAEALQIRAPNLEAERQAGYAQAGVTGGIPSFEALLARTPPFATMDPEELKKLQMQMGFAYRPPAPLGAALGGG